MKRVCVRHTAILLAFLFLTAPLAPVRAQNRNRASGNPSAARFNLTIDNIMRGNELVGYEPRAVRWSGDRIYFQWKQYNDSSDRDFDTYVVNSDGTGLKKLSEAEAKAAPPAFGEDSKDKRSTVFVEDGDVFVYDHTTGQRRQITSTTDIESNAHFTSDQKSIYFTRASNLYVMSLDNGSL